MVPNEIWLRHGNVKINVCKKLKFFFGVLEIQAKHEFLLVNLIRRRQLFNHFKGKTLYLKKEGRKFELNTVGIFH